MLGGSLLRDLFWHHLISLYSCPFLKNKIKMGCYELGFGHCVSLIKSVQFFHQFKFVPVHAGLLLLQMFVLSSTFGSILLWSPWLVGFNFFRWPKVRIDKMFIAKERRPAVRVFPCLRHWYFFYYPHTLNLDSLLAPRKVMGKFGLCFFSKTHSRMGAAVGSRQA